MKRKKIDYQRLWRMFKPSIAKAKWYIFISFLLVTVAAAFSITEPYLYGSIIDVIVNSLNVGTSIPDTFQQLTVYLGVWVFILITTTLIAAFQSYVANLIANKIIQNVLLHLFHHLLSLDLQRFEDEPAGAMLEKVYRTWSAIWNANEAIVRTILQACMTFLFGVIIGFIIDWRLAICAVLPLPIIVGLGLYNLRVSESDQRIIHKRWEKIGGIIGDSFSNIATVKSFVGESIRESIVGKLYAKTLTEQLHVNKKWAIVDSVYGGVYIAGRLLIFVAGVYFVIQGTTTIGTLIMFLGFLNFIFGSVQQMAMTLPRLLDAFSRFDRTADVWFEEPYIQNTKKAKVVKSLRGLVEFNHVSFFYNKNAPVLEKISFSIPDGKTVAIVGKSGAGKSTLAKMLLRFYDPTKGSIRFDGVDIRSYTLHSLRKQVGLVMQENLLFNDTILNNIKFAKPNASKNEIEDAAKRAQAHDFILKLPKGYKTMVGERGVKLSGGEKQRIAIARVLLENPPILVLDEATSALDSKTEHDLQEALKEVMKKRTTLVIAHRLSTVMAADNILVMDKGCVIDQGTHSELIKKDSLYREYWEIQAGGYM